MQLDKQCPKPARSDQDIASGRSRQANSKAFMQEQACLFRQSFQMATQPSHSLSTCLMLGSICHSGRRDEWDRKHLSQTISSLLFSTRSDVPCSTPAYRSRLPARISNHHADGYIAPKLIHCSQAPAQVGNLTTLVVYTLFGHGGILNTF